MTKPKFTPGPWHVENRDKPYVMQENGIALAQIWKCSVMSREEADANAHLIAAAPELYDALLAHLSATCIRCKNRNCKFDKESFIQNEGCGCCEGIFREQWKLLKKVRDGE